MVKRTGVCAGCARFTSEWAWSNVPGCVLAVLGSLVSRRGQTFRGVCLSSSAQTHSLHKLQTPSRCVECDHYVYFQGAECHQVTDSLQLLLAFCICFHSFSIVICSLNEISIPLCLVC